MPERGRLLQVLGMWFGIAAAVGNTIAAGIVRTPGDIAKLVPNVWVFFAIWVAGGCYALIGASSLAELGAAIPRSVDACAVPPGSSADADRWRSLEIALFSVGVAVAGRFAVRPSAARLAALSAVPARFLERHASLQGRYPRP